MDPSRPTSLLLPGARLQGSSCHGLPTPGVVYTLPAPPARVPWTQLHTNTSHPAVEPKQPTSLLLSGTRLQGSSCPGFPTPGAMYTPPAPRAVDPCCSAPSSTPMFQPDDNTTKLELARSCQPSRPYIQCFPTQPSETKPGLDKPPKALRSVLDELPKASLSEMNKLPKDSLSDHHKEAHGNPLATTHAQVPPSSSNSCSVFGASQGRDVPRGYDPLLATNPGHDPCSVSTQPPPHRVVLPKATAALVFAAHPAYCIRGRAPPHQGEAWPRRAAQDFAG